MANAALEGVIDRVEIHDGDMRAMPFPDATFDAVMASLSIHNIPDAPGRLQAIREIARVLKPGGQLALLDFRKTGEYARGLRGLGWTEVRRTAPTLWIFPPSRTVIGTKPF